MQDHIRLLAIFTRLKSQTVCAEKDRPYVALCLFVIRKALDDANNDFKSRYRNQKLRSMHERLSVDAKKFLCGKGLEVWLRASGFDKHVSPGYIRHLANNPDKLYFARQDDHDFSNV